MTAGAFHNYGSVVGSDGDVPFWHSFRSTVCWCGAWSLCQPPPLSTSDIKPQRLERWHWKENVSFLSGLLDCDALWVDLGVSQQPTDKIPEIDWLSLLVRLVIYSKILRRQHVLRWNLCLTEADKLSPSATQNRYQHTDEISRVHGLWWQNSCLACKKDGHSSAAVTQEQRYCTKKGGTCLRGGGLGGLRDQKHLAKFLFYGRPVLCSWCDAFAPLLSKRGCSCHFYERSFTARLNGLKWQLSLLFFLSFLFSFFLTILPIQANLKKKEKIASLLFPPVFLVQSKLPEEKIYAAIMNKARVCFYNYGKPPRSVDCFP